MCSQNVCECPTESHKVWASIVEDDLRQYGRIASWAQATQDEFLELKKKGQFDSKVVALHFADTENTVDNYKECYQNHLSEIFEEET